MATGDKPVECTGIGTLSVGNLTAPDALHVPGLNDTLISVDKVCNHGRIVVFTRREAIILYLK